MVFEFAAVLTQNSSRRYIFEGLSLLMDQLLVHNARYIRLANQFGQAKMLRNILALQQNLKNLGDTPLDVDFERSRKFWDLFAAGPKVRNCPLARVFSVTLTTCTTAGYARTRPPGPRAVRL